MSDETAPPADDKDNAPTALAPEVSPEPELAALVPAQESEVETAAEVESSAPEAAEETPAVHEESREVEPESEPAAAPDEPAPDSGSAEPAKPKRARKAKSAAAGSGSPAPESDESGAPPAGDGAKKWYVVKVQSGREDSIKAAIERKVKIEGLEQYFGQIAIPVEEMVVKKSVKVKDKKTGDKVTQEKKVVKHTKKYPGYLFAEVDFNDRILYLFRETSGVGDFVGAGLKREPTPMTEREVTQMLTGIVGPDDRKKGGPVKVKLDYEKGDKVKIRDGAFANMEGEVKSITDVKESGESPKVTVVVTVFGRPVDVTVDYWHVDKL